MNGNLLALESRGPVAVALALVGALALVPLVRAAARRGGAVSRPRADRWSQKPTALLGGIAIFGAFVLGALLLLPEIQGNGIILGASAFLFGVGLVDDLRPLRPYQKLFGQLAGAAVVAALVVGGGPTLPWTSWRLLDGALALFWLVGITNALNLLDNMDGLSAGVAAVAACFLAAGFFADGPVAEGYLVAVFAAALIGFLAFNYNPASIFMGDCGALFIGFFLASAALIYVAEGRSLTIVEKTVCPVLVLFVPIFDTTLVTVCRLRAGRSIAQGGRDHTSHRLVALGFSERGAVNLLYGLAYLGGLTAVGVRYLPLELSVGLVALVVVLGGCLGVILGRVKVYRPESG